MGLRGVVRGLGEGAKADAPAFSLTRKNGDPKQGRHSHYGEKRAFYFPVSFGTEKLPPKAESDQTSLSIGVLRTLGKSEDLGQDLVIGFIKNMTGRSIYEVNYSDKLLPEAEQRETIVDA